MRIEVWGESDDRGMGGLWAGTENWGPQVAFALLLLDVCSLSWRVRRRGKNGRLQAFTTASTTCCRLLSNLLLFFSSSVPYGAEAGALWATKKDFGRNCLLPPASLAATLSSSVSFTYPLRRIGPLLSFFPPSPLLSLSFSCPVYTPDPFRQFSRSPQPLCLLLIPLLANS
ncbi:unnamed protein product [Phaeothamnion confervicola]